MKVKVKAKVSFAGVQSMTEGEVKEVELKDFEEFLQIGYVEKVVAKKKASTKK